VRVRLRLLETNPSQNLNVGETIEDDWHCLTSIPNSQPAQPVGHISKSRMNFKFNLSGVLAHEIADGRCSKILGIVSCAYISHTSNFESTVTLTMGRTFQSYPKGFDE
jgi:hypothetical protein